MEKFTKFKKSEFEMENEHMSERPNETKGDELQTLPDMIACPRMVLPAG